MKKIFLFAALILSAFTSSAQISDLTDINDLALIYIGSQHRPDWNKELFYPYVVHDYLDGKKSWMFDGFLMIEFMKWNKNNKQVSFGEYVADGALQEDWKDLVDEQLGTKTGFGCKALDELIGEMIPVLGKPGHKHKVVLTMPSADASTGTTWGSAYNVKLDLMKAEDRIKAHKWYVDYIISQWNNAGFKNLELDGIYWVKEAMAKDQHYVVQTANDYVHSKGLKVYWIPYFNAASNFEWQELGMDMAYLQPNYYFSTETPISRLDTAIERVLQDENYGMGLEIEFEGYNFSWSPEKGRTRQTPENCGMYGISPIFYQRLVDYIDHFEDQGVFTFQPLAYYSGFQAVFDFMNSGNVKDHQLMDRLALLMNTRHVDSDWDREPVYAGIDDVTADERNVAFGVDGGIIIADTTGCNVSVFTADGRVVYTRAGGNRSEYFECPRGIYIVHAGGRAVKVAVK